MRPRDENNTYSMWQSWAVLVCESFKIKQETEEEENEKEKKNQRIIPRVSFPVFAGLSLTAE